MALRSDAGVVTSRRGAFALGAPVVAVIVLAEVGLALQGAGLLDSPYALTWEAVFAALVVQAVPFLMLGVIASALLSLAVSDRTLARVLPSHDGAAVVVACAAGAALPGCECGSVPLARRLVDRRVPASAALTFMLAAPAINPVVLVATAVAFPGRPEMVLARLAASSLASIAAGLVWLRLGRRLSLTPRTHAAGHDHPGRTRGDRFAAALVEDLVQAGGFLTVGAAAAATMQVAIPGRVVAQGAVASFVTMALLAVVLSICSEADAFVASSLAPGRPIAQLAFITVGPAIDLKLASLQAGLFGPRFAVVFGALALAVTTASAALIGTVLL
jgi:hypothetical protein